MTEAQLQAALDESRALTLALIERLNEKLAPGSFVPLLTKEDVTKILHGAEVMQKRFAREREERARGLVLPPGART